MSGKTCLVTGATAGIGFVTACELARRGATVVIVGRHMTRGVHAVEAIQRASGNASVAFLPADLSSLADVRALAAQFLARHDRLDVLVNNAGALFAVRRESIDGIEMTLALNHLAPFLLTQLLRDALRNAAPSRIVNVASGAHKDVPGFDFDDPQAARGAYPRTELGSTFFSLVMPWAHPGYRQYARTKLANILFTAALARRLDGSGVCANALHPGVVASEFSNGNGVYGWFMRRYMGARGISVQDGAKTSIHVAAAPELEGVSGRYFVERREAQPSAEARDPATAERLWDLSERLVTG